MTHERGSLRIPAVSVACSILLLFAGLGGRALAQGEGGAEVRVRYALTENAYLETADLAAAVRAEFGPAAEVADWTEIVERFGGSLAAVEMFADGIGLEYDGHAWVTVDGERVFAGTGLLGEAGRVRHYFVSRWDGAKPDTYQAHDQIAGHFLSLGSWYDLQLPILVRMAR